MADLDGQRYVDRLRCEFRDEVFDIAAETGLRLDIVLRSAREDWTQHAVAADFGVSVLPAYSVVVDGLALRPIAGLTLERQIEIVTVRGRRHRPVVRRVVAALAAHDWHAGLDRS